MHPTNMRACHANGQWQCSARRLQLLIATCVTVCADTVAVKRPIDAAGSTAATAHWQQVHSSRALQVCSKYNTVVTKRALRVHLSDSVVLDLLLKCHSTSLAQLRDLGATLPVGLPPMRASARQLGRVRAWPFALCLRRTKVTAATTNSTSNVALELPIDHTSSTNI